MTTLSRALIHCTAIAATAACGAPPTSTADPGQTNDAAVQPDTGRVSDANGPDTAPDARGPDGGPDSGAPDAGDGLCRKLSIEFTPSDNLQLVAWLEDNAGNYVDTIFITRLTGAYGLGNRPGMMEFNSGPLWPQGRRISTFPIWSHRHGMEFPLIVFQNGDDDNLSHPLGQSSLEHFYCRPLLETEPLWDAVSCATTVFTDKGKLSATLTSRYPPRSDVVVTPGVDDPAVATYASLNPFDVVSQATPVGGALASFEWTVPLVAGAGDYSVWLEVSKEFDQNQYYDYPEPEGIPWREYGVAYRGQPSVVYRVPIPLSSVEASASTASYEGYGDPDGIDGNVRLPDATITTGVDGSGASRIGLTSDGAELFRVRASLRCPP